MNQSSVTESDLHAYIDGLLPEPRRLEIESYLAGRPEEAERVHAYRRQRQELRALFDPVMDEQVPQRLLAVPRSRSWQVQRVAAGIVIALVSGSAGWMMHGMQSSYGGIRPAAQVEVLTERGLPKQAAIAHVVYSPDVRRPVEIGAEQEEQLVAWLSKRIGTPIRPPKLGKLGFELIGGRLLPGGSGPVAQFMYHDVAGQRLTLYVSTEQSRNKDTGFRFSQEGPVNVFYWIDGKFGYALSAGIDKGRMAELADAVYEQLEDGRQK
jgi:anti-sigma factor RsiW